MSLALFLAMATSSASFGVSLTVVEPNSVDAKVIECRDDLLKRYTVNGEITSVAEKQRLMDGATNYCKQKLGVDNEK